MPKRSAEIPEDELRPEYNLTKLGGGIQGKYYRQAKAGTNLVLIEPDLAQAFPDQESVNRALRLLAATASTVTRRSPRSHTGPTAPNRGRKPSHQGE
ncbi:MAG: hypothetical protein ACRD3O_07880 [Terriglobia bacterium]